MAVTAADVPAKYDVVFVGVPNVSDFGCVYADSVEPSLPFRTHRAIYDRTPTFIERQNISGSWGDDQQDFFMTQSQNDWSLGSGQRYFNDPADATQSRKFWASLRAEIDIPGEASLAAAASTFTPAGAVKSSCGRGLPAPLVHAFVTATNLYTVDSTGTVTNQGAHGANTGAGAVYQWGMCSDGVNIYISGNSLVRWNGAAFAAWTGLNRAGAIAFLNNQLYACDGSSLYSVPAAFAGALTTIFTWKDASGTALTAFNRAPKVIPFGGTLLIYFPVLFDRPSLWQYDGTSTKVVAELTPSAIGYDMITLNGIVYLSGAVSSSVGSSANVGAKPTIWEWDGSTIAKVWESLYVAGANTINAALMPSLGVYSGDLVFTDPAAANGPGGSALLMRYVLATGAIYTLTSYTVNIAGVFSPCISSTGGSLLLSFNDASTSSVFYPLTFASAMTLDTSLFTFNSSLTKLLRGVTIDWTGDTAPNVSYQVGSVDGSYTALASGVASGVETAFPANTAGRGVSIRVTIPSGTTKIKRIMVRAAPELASFKRGVYILDCTGTTDKPRQLRDRSAAPLTGYETVQNLLAAATTKTPFTVTDKINGTYTGLVDLQDPEGWDVYEVHPYPDDKKRPGSYIVRVTVREV